MAALKDIRCVPRASILNIDKQRSQDIHAHCARQEELARYVEDLAAEFNHEREARERAESDLTKLTKTMTPSFALPGCQS